MEVDGPIIFDNYRGLSTGSGGEIQLADTLNVHSQRYAFETVHLNGQRLNCSSVDEFCGHLQMNTNRSW